MLVFNLTKLPAGWQVQTKLKIRVPMAIEIALDFASLPAGKHQTENPRVPAHRASEVGEKLSADRQASNPAELVVGLVTHSHCCA